MGVQTSFGRGVLNGTGISNSSPVHRSVGVAVIDEFCVAVGVFEVGDPVDVEGCGFSVSAQAPIRTIAIKINTGRTIKRILRDFIVVPPTLKITGASKRPVRSGVSFIANAEDNHTGKNVYDGVILVYLYPDCQALR